ncbi:hypothetical protein [Arthrobacter sp. MA-N2]|uniref:hypothetical protein n=1 Tax=Arthrobacter sp. MA-N2 TaxID=1101188 RepID=UPI001E445A1E|nr:hypothetical protein [Arthrobacter sp. MA-N2]
MRRKKAGQQPAEPRYPMQDWSWIEVGADVEVQYPMGVSYKARVDAKSPDSKIVWVTNSNGHGRKMYGHWEGIRLLQSLGHAYQESPV